MKESTIPNAEDTLSRDALFIVSINSSNYISHSFMNILAILYMQEVYKIICDSSIPILKRRALF